MKQATGFDLFSRGQWDDFRVWFFAGSDACFVRFVYLMVRTQVPPRERRGEPHVYRLCVSGPRSAGSSGTRNVSLLVSSQDS